MLTENIRKQPILGLVGNQVFFVLCIFVPALWKTVTIAVKILAFNKTISTQLETHKVCTDLLTILKISS